VLTRAKNLSDGAAEQIGISIMETPLAPEDFIPRQGVVDGIFGSRDAQWSWSIYQSHKTFSMTLASGNTAQWFVYFFGESKVYQFRLSPNDQKQPGPCTKSHRFLEGNNLLCAKTIIRTPRARGNATEL